MELGKVSWVLHLFKDDALLHLADVLLLDNAHELGKDLIHEVGVELVVVSHGLGAEVFAALF